MSNTTKRVSELTWIVRYELRRLRFAARVRLPEEPISPSRACFKRRINISGR